MCQTFGLVSLLAPVIRAGSIITIRVLGRVAKSLSTGLGSPTGSINLCCHSILVQVEVHSACRALDE